MDKTTQVIDVLSMGYGTVPRSVMSDRKLTVEAKAIYAYFAACIGAGDTSFPTVGEISKDLNMGKDRFQKHKKKLIEKGVSDDPKRYGGKRQIQHGCVCD